MCSSKVVKVAALIISHQIFKIYEKEVRTFEEGKGLLIPHKNHKGRLFNKYRRCVQAVFFPALLVCSCFFILRRKRKMFVLAESWVVSPIDSVSTDGVCGKMFVRRSKCSNPGRLRTVYPQAGPVSKRENRNRDEVHGNSFRSCLQC